MRLTLMRSAAASACFVDAFVVSRQKNPEIIKKAWLQNAIRVNLKISFWAARNKVQIAIHVINLRFFEVEEKKQSGIRPMAGACFNM